MNKLVVIGCMGMKRAYLNMSEAEALRRYRACDDYIPSDEDNIATFEFEDEFGCYDLWQIL